MSRASRDWHDAMQRAFVTNEDCTCPSKDHAEVRPHDDDCPTTLLRNQLTSGEWQFEEGRFTKAMLAFGEWLQGIVTPVSRRLTGRLGLWAMPVGLAAIVGWSFFPFFVTMPTWWWTVSWPVSIYLGTLAGQVLGEHGTLLRARREVELLRLEEPE